MDLRGIEIFLAICEHGSFTAAAQSLGLTQAAVSQHIIKLERELGVGLIDRAVRPQKLTAAGQHLQRRSRVPLDDLRQIQSELKNYREHDIPFLRLGLIESVAGAILSLIVQQLKGSIGSLSIVSGTTNPLIPELLAGNFDLLVTSEQPGEEDGLRSEGLLIEPVLLILPKDRSPPQDWSDMAAIVQELDLVRYAGKRHIGRIIDRLLERHGLQARGTLAIDSSPVLFDCIRSGGNWGVSTPMCLLSAGVDVANFTITTFPDAFPIRSINAIWRAERDGVEIQFTVDALRHIIAKTVYPQLLRRSGGVPERLHLASRQETITKAAS